MKNIILPQKELRLLSNQLQNFQTGYTVQQIRSLDKVIKTVEATIADFTDKLTKLLDSHKKNLEGLEGKKKEIEIEKSQKELDDFVSTEGNKNVTCPLEDTDFEFVKMVWSKIGTFSGSRDAREAILVIDDAIQGASEPVFAKGVN